MDAPLDPARDPWRRRTRRVAYENAWIVVWHDEVVRPDGGDGVYGVVHPHGLAVGVVALDEHDRVLLVGQWRYTLGRWTWELPEGGVPRDETPLAGAMRELAEETGYRATRWRELLRTALSNSVSDEEGVLFVAEGLVAGEAAWDETEEIAIRFVPFEEALAMVERGEIDDALTQLGLLRLARERSARSPGSVAP